MSDAAWDRIVGVPVEQWIAADTPAKFADLLDQRDNPRPCAVDHRNDVDVMDWIGNLVSVVHSEPCNGTHEGSR